MKKALKFFVQLFTLNVGKHKGEEVQKATPTGRSRISFREFCEITSLNTTFSPQEVAAVMNHGISTARRLVAGGDTVEFGDMGTLIPYIKSKSVPKDKAFNVKEHIVKAVIRLRQSAKYFNLDDVHFERVEPPVKKKKKKKDEGGSPIP